MSCLSPAACREVGFPALVAPATFASPALVGEDVSHLGPEAVRMYAPIAIQAKVPNAPTPDELAQHELTHLPVKP